jgi:hypothetical protein
MVHSDRQVQPANLLLQGLVAGRMTMRVLGWWDGITPTMAVWPACQAGNLASKCKGLLSSHEGLRA